MSLSIPRFIELSVTALSLASLGDVPSWISGISGNWRRVTIVSAYFLVEHSVLSGSSASVLLAMASLRSDPHWAAVLAHLAQAVHLLGLGIQVTLWQTTILVLLHAYLAWALVAPGMWEWIIGVDCAAFLVGSRRTFRRRQIHIGQEKGWEAVWTALTVVWMPVLALSVIDALAQIGMHHRRMVLAHVLGSANIQPVQAIFLLALSQTSMLRRFIAMQLRAIYRSFQLAVDTAVLQHKHCCNAKMQDWVYLHSDMFITRAASFVACFPRIVAEAYNLYLITGVIGWHVAIPVSVTLVYSIACKAIDWAVDCSNDGGQKNTGSSNQSLLSRTVFILENISEIRRNGWEGVLADTAEPHYLRPKGQMLFRVLSYAIGLIGSSTAQITAAMAIISRFQMDNDITYIDVILLMPALNSLSDALSYAGNALGNAAQVYRLLGLYCGIFGGSEATSIARIPRHPAGMAMYLYGASFAWRDGETPVLESVSLDVRYGDVVAVIGRVGSGKSALLAAMSGSLSRCGGVAAVLGDVGLVEPSTWVLDDTFRANIVLDRPFDESKYWQTIENCALGHVVHNWPSGDMEIVNRHMLSASQCSLLSLARAVYADADILLVDDIFSYIDLRTRDRLLAGVLAADPRRAIVAVSRSKPIVSLATKVVRVESGRAIVTKQVPSQWKPGVSLKSDCFDGSLSPIAESILSEGTALDPVEAAAAENISTSRSMRPSLEWWHLAKYSALCGYSWIVVALAVQCIGLYTAFHVDGYRRELIVDAGSHQGLSRALYDYLVSDVVVSIIQQQLVVCESWIRRELWSTKAKVAISQGVMNTVLSSSGAQADWSFRDKALSLLVKGRYVLSSELPQQLNQRAVLALRSGYIAAQVFYTSPVIGLFVVPFVAGYVGVRLWWRALAAKQYTANIPTVAVDDQDDQTETYESYISAAARYSRKRQSLSVELRLSERDDYIASVESAIGDIFATMASMSWLLWPFVSQHVAGSAAVLTSADVDVAMRLSELESLLGTERKPLQPMLAIVPQYFGFTSGKEQAADTSPRGKAIVTGGKVVVECRNLGLQLHGCTTPLYSNISFALCTGEQLAVIGHNGRGKSVLVRSLFRLANLGPSTATASGSVTINGTDTSTICDSEISDLADFVTSDQVIFDASLRKNLDPLGKFTDAELTRAMRRAGMPEIMPNTTLDTRIMRPSTCQKRMIALCRSLLSKRPIVVFDQLTAGMDALTQKAVHAVVASEFKNRAVVNITNQPSEILSSNYVVAVQ